MSEVLQDKVFIVTGGSKGFGLTIAQSLVAQGAKVGLVSRGKEALAAAVSQLGKAHAMGVVADVSSSSSVSAAFSAIKTHFGRLDGLINNAGMARPNKIEKLREEEVVMQINTNFLGTVLCSQVAIPLLRGAENPRIINISSASAWHYDEMSHLSIYAATKAAVERFTRDLAKELQADGIGVTCVRPGGAWTNFADGWEEAPLAAALESWMDAGTYMNIGMETEQVAQAVCFSLTQPPGVAVDLLEVRPTVLAAKGKF